MIGVIGSPKSCFAADSTGNIDGLRCVCDAIQPQWGAAKALGSVYKAGLKGKSYRKRGVRMNCDCEGQ